MKKTFYVTTPIYYVNAKPHIGSLYATLAADILARFHRMRGEDVFFLTGTDENSQKTLKAAEKLGREPFAYLEEMADVWKNVWAMFDISYDRFIRTTEEGHHSGVRRFFEAIESRHPENIEKGSYEGWYCVDCEEFYPEDKLVGGQCPIHKRSAEWIKEDNYFFKASHYQTALEKYFIEHPEFVQPEYRKNEMLGLLRAGLQDTSISRAGGKWGIRFPKDEGHAVYVWFEALMNYVTGIGYGSDDAEARARFDRFWPANVHIIGKEISRFHTLLWPAMLMSAGLAVPQQVFVHGFLTVDGEKMSKSLGNAVDPVELRERYSSDAIRYFLFREFPFGQDGDFSYMKLEERYRKELANELGNLVNRVLSMTEKYCGGVVPGVAPVDLDARVAGAWVAYETAMEHVDFSGALEAVRGLVALGNEYIEQQQPWQVAKTDAARVAQLMANLMELLRHIGWLVRPFMPRVSDEMFRQMGLGAVDGVGGADAGGAVSDFSYDDMKVWGCVPAGTRVNKGAPLFPLTEE